MNPSTQGAVPPTQDVAGASTSGSKAKRTRGPNRCIILNNLDDPIEMEYNEVGQPVGDSDKKISSYLGLIARDGVLAPIDCVDWRRMPDERKSNMWGAVQAKFNIDERLRKWIFEKISRNWRNWKCGLKKKYYEPHVDDRLWECPGRVDPQQWASLIEFWKSQEGVARATRNSQNRARQKMNHTAGTKSFARIREEARMRNSDGQAPDRIEVFRLTHTRRDGRPVDSASEAVMREFDERLRQQPEGSQSSTARNDIFTQVMGEDKHGRVRTFGCGVTPFDIYGARPSVAEARKMAETEKALRISSEARVVALEGKMDRMQHQVDQMMTLLQRVTEGGQPPFSSELLTGAPDEDSRRG